MDLQTLMGLLQGQDLSKLTEVLANVDEGTRNKIMAAVPDLLSALNNSGVASNLSEGKLPENLSENKDIMGVLTNILDSNNDGKLQLDDVAGLVGKFFKK